jgi:DNA-binding MurR/RpiR family transcriptional regulator
MFLTRGPSLFTRIQDALPTMSEAKKNVGKYILENWHEVAFHSASKLARASKVSESVVVRFSQDIGYSGFPELQSSLHAILRNRLTGIYGSKNENDIDSLSDRHDSQTIQRVYDLTLNNLQSVMHCNEYQTFLNAAEAILKAKRIMVVAGRNASGPGKILAVHLNEIFTNTTLINSGSDDLFDHIRSLSNEDLLITISLPGYIRNTVRASDFAAKKKVPQITITDSMSSPLVRNANTVLITSFKSYSYGSSHVATVFLIDSLIHIITIKDKGHVLKSLEELAEINREYGMYEIE